MTNELRYTAFVLAAFIALAVLFYLFGATGPVAS